VAITRNGKNLASLDSAFTSILNSRSQTEPRFFDPEVRDRIWILVSSQNEDELGEEAQIVQLIWQKYTHIHLVKSYNYILKFIRKTNPKYWLPQNCIHVWGVLKGLEQPLNDEIQGICNAVWTNFHGTTAA
jgi:hypothetical protein